MIKPPKTLEDAIRQEINGEPIVWAGIPEMWGYARRKWKTAIFGIPFTAFALFWEYQVWSTQAVNGKEAGYFALFWGGMFIIAGIGMLLSPLASAFASRHIYYVITNKRALIFRRFPSLLIHSFSAKSLSNYERLSNAGTTGNLIFKRIVKGKGRHGDAVEELGFFSVRDYRSAEKAIERVLANNPEPLM